MSPIEFSMYINDLATGVKGPIGCVNIDDMNLTILVYADDIDFISQDEESLQNM